MTILERIQIAAGIVVSIATLFIGWKTYELSQLTETGNVRLLQIQQELEGSKFTFEQMRDIYDRTEKYLSSEDQSERRGKALIVLVRSMPENALRADLLELITTDATSVLVAAQAADPKSTSADKPETLETLIKGLDPGSFFGTPSFRINPDGYTITVDNEFGFVDSAGQQWRVPAGFVSDGASIPRSLWSVFGAPLSGNMTVASVIHDFYATSRTRSADDLNKMYHEALIKSGVDATTAGVVFSAVAAFGPRWADPPGNG